MRINIKHVNKQEGFTLVELMISAAILVIAVTGILLSYLRCLELNDIARHSTLCLQAAKSQIEAARSTNYADIATNFHLDTFTINGVNAMGVSYIDASVPELLTMTVSVSWREKTGRIMGEDANLNGVLDSGEDVNGNGLLDSPIQIVSRIAQR